MKEPKEQTLEQQVASQVRDSIGEAIKKKLEGYGTPLDKIIERAVAAQQEELFDLIRDAFAEVTIGEIKAQIKQSAAHKIAKVLVSKMEGEIEKRVNDFRSDPATRARIVLAIEKAISEPK